MRAAGWRRPSRFRMARAYSMSNGAALGSIMPAIMAAHIAQSSTRRGPSQVTVIIHAEAPDMGPYMSRAMAMTQIQQAAGSTITTRARLTRGRISALSSGDELSGTGKFCQSRRRMAENKTKPMADFKRRYS